MSKTITKDKVSEKLDELISQPYVLILHNDDFSTFDWVISCLMKHCGHEYEQASQCAHLVHYVGKCDVKRGSKEIVEEAYDKLKSSGLSVTMETI
jgi:ATP-dependent Clp protease adaptor protein ClpS